MACQNGRHTTVTLLLDNGVDASVPLANECGHTPAMISCVMGHVKILALLLDRGADPNLANKDGHTPAHSAVEGGHVKCLQLLIKRGANINYKEVYGFTPLDFARGFKHRECENLLLLNGGVGEDIEDLPPLTEANKVCIAASFRASNTFLLVSLHFLVLPRAIMLSLPRNTTPTSTKRRRPDRRMPEDATTRRARRVPVTKATRGPRSVRLVRSRCTAAPRVKLRTGPRTQCCAKS
jgi:hypothetical protein